MLKASVIATISLVVMAAALPMASEATVIDVQIKDFVFEPEDVEVLVGDTVRWTNRGFFQHTSTSGESMEPDGLWDSGPLGRNASFPLTIGSAGVFPYFCSFHPLMTGTVRSISPVAIAVARDSADGTDVGLRAGVVIGILADGFYVESADRAAGVFVSSTSSPALGQSIDVIGAMSTSGCRRQISARVVRVSGQSAGPVKPLGMANGAVGRAPGQDALLARVWGRATDDQGADYFTIGDGSLPGGLRIASGSLGKPSPGQFVAVTGVVVCEGVAGSPTILPRSQDDIQAQ